MIQTRSRSPSATLWVFCLLTVGSLLGPMYASAQAEGPCDSFIFRVNASNLKHVGAGAVIYGGSRLVGLGPAPSVGLAFAGNLAKEIRDPCFDGADLLAGTLGGLLALGVERLLGGSDDGPDGVELGVQSSSWPLRVQLRVPF